MHALFFAVTAAFASLEEWTPLPPPTLCRVGLETRIPPVLASGAHVELSRGDAANPREAPSALFPYATFLQMAEDEARANGGRLEVQRFEGGALVRGEKSVVAAASALASEFEAAARMLDVDLVVTLTPSPPSTGATPLRFERRVPSGALTFFGTREILSFVAGFSVQVAAESGQSEPVMGRVHHGRGLHLTASRVAGGERVFLQGFFDVAEVTAVTEFDPDTADLGVLQQPRVAWTQVEFAGVVGRDGHLQVDVRGTGGATSEWKLEIAATTTRDDASARSDGSGYAVIDLAFTSAGLHGANERVEPRLFSGKRTLPSDMRAASIPASAIASLVEAARGPSPRTGRASLYWSDRLLLVPRSDALALAEVRALVAGLEAARLSQSDVSVGMGPLSAKFPVATGANARFVSGSERPLLVEYRLEVAPQIWMPAPIVENVFDGACFEFIAADSALDVSLSTAWSGPIVEIARESAQIGRLQTLARSVSSGAVRVAMGTSAKLDLSGTGPGVATVRVDRR
ncbi:MAG: hypothetical protein SGI72_06025 [Planctomycetota bacterium]|nr:hypothetical protein [Planctomycetota bacterium]